MYNEKVMKIFEKPRNAGTILNASGVGKVGNVKCGDVMKISIKVEKNVITDAKFKTFGCVSAIAASDTACELVRGKTIEGALKMTNQEIVNELGGLPVHKIHCSVLGKEAIDAAIKDYKKKLEKDKKKK